MADFYTQFSCIFDVGTVENADRAEAILDEFEANLDNEEDAALGFEMERDPASGPGALWISSTDYGEPEHVIQFVLRCATDLKLGGLWGFTWSHCCSKPRLDAFGGGAHVLDLSTGATVADIDCSDFVYERLARTEDNIRITAPEGEGNQS